MCILGIKKTRILCWFRICKYNWGKRGLNGQEQCVQLRCIAVIYKFCRKTGISPHSKVEKIWRFSPLYSFYLKWGVIHVFCNYVVQFEVYIITLQGYTFFAIMSYSLNCTLSHCRDARFLQLCCTVWSVHYSITLQGSVIMYVLFGFLFTCPAIYQGAVIQNLYSRLYCFGSGWIRIQIVRLDQDPYSESGSGSWEWNSANQIHFFHKFFMIFTYF